MRSGLSRANRRLVAARSRGEDGFTLVEAIVAISMAAVLLLSMSYATATGLDAVVSTKLTQQATHLGSEALEKARELPYDSLTMITSDLAGDPAITGAGTCSTDTTGATHYFDPDGASGPLLCERIVQAGAPGPEGGVFPHREPVSINTADFIVSQYVTYVDRDAQGGPDNDLKRMVVIVSWTDGERARTFRATTLVSRAQRGLGTPDFDLSPDDQTLSANPGDRVSFGHNIANHGVPDTFEISVTIPAGRAWIPSIYRDANFNATYDPTIDLVQFLDTDGDGAFNTPGVLTGETLYFVVVWQLAPLEPLGDNLTTVITASPSIVGGASETSTDTLFITNAGLRLFLHNRPTPPTTGTVLTRDLDMTPAPPTATTMFPYSTNYASTTPGRYLKRSNAQSNASTNEQEWVNWNYPAPTTITLAGTASALFYVNRTPNALGQCSGVLDFRIFLRHKSSATTATGTDLSQFAVSSAACGAWSPVNASFNLASVVIPNNGVLELKILLRQTSGSDAFIGYDTTSQAAVLELPA